MEQLPFWAFHIGIPIALQQTLRRKKQIGTTATSDPSTLIGASKNTGITPTCLSNLKKAIPDGYFYCYFLEIMVNKPK